jgi:cyclopropane-fatty-acyl-phospholipid synthase
MDFKRPPARVLANIVRSIGIEHLKPIAPPPRRRAPLAGASQRVAAQQDP